MENNVPSEVDSVDNIECEVLFVSGYYQVPSYSWDPRGIDQFEKTHHMPNRNQVLIRDEASA